MDCCIYILVCFY